MYCNSISRVLVEILVIKCCLLIDLTQPCVSFFCLNSCGSPLAGSARKGGDKGGFKLIFANNRDANVNMLGASVNVWPPKRGQTAVEPIAYLIDNEYKCDQSQLEPPYNLCSVGPLNIGEPRNLLLPPKDYNTWLGINERGTLANLLTLCSSFDKSTIRKRVGNIVGESIQSSAWEDTPAFLRHLNESRQLYAPFNYVQLEMSNTTGRYSLYYTNNMEARSAAPLNDDKKDEFIFGI